MELIKTQALLFVLLACFGVAGCNDNNAKNSDSNAANTPEADEEMVEEPEPEGNFLSVISDRIVATVKGGYLSDDGHVFLHNRYSDILKVSKDGGQTWIEMVHPIKNVDSIIDGFWKNDVIYVEGKFVCNSCRYGLHPALSIDRGSSWTTHTSRSVIDLILLDDTGHSVLAKGQVGYWESANFYLSNDGGTSWTDLTSEIKGSIDSEFSDYELGKNLYRSSMMKSTCDNNTIWLNVGIPLVSYDQANTWQRFEISGLEAYVEDTDAVISDIKNISVHCESHYKLVDTENWIIKLNPENEVIDAINIWALFERTVLDQNNGYVYRVNAGKLFRTSVTAVEALEAIYDNSVSYYSVDSTGNHIVIVLGDGGIRYSPDKGASWHELPGEWKDSGLARIRFAPGRDDLAVADIWVGHELHHVAIDLSGLGD